jgi:hypothetical protein
MHPGVADGASAELQWAGPLLGICHSPAYAVQVSFLKLFGALPIGGSLAWRANVMSAVFGIAGCLALYGAVRRMTGRVLPGWIAATTLAFSSVFWSHALVAETYVFGAGFILLAVYSAVRFVESDRSAWLWATALLLGVAVAERPPRGAGRAGLSRSLARLPPTGSDRLATRLDLRRTPRASLRAGRWAERGEE